MVLGSGCRGRHLFQLDQPRVAVEAGFDFAQADAHLAFLLNRIFQHGQGRRNAWQSGGTHAGADGSGRVEKRVAEDIVFTGNFAVHQRQRLLARLKSGLFDHRLFGVDDQLGARFFRGGGSRRRCRGRLLRGDGGDRDQP